MWVCQQFSGGKMLSSTKRLPGPFSRKMTLDSGKKLEPLMTISSPPLTRQLARLDFSTCGSSCAERWAGGGLVGGRRGWSLSEHARCTLTVCQGLPNGVNQNRSDPPRPVTCGFSCGHSQHSTGMEAACSDSTLPLGWGMCTLNTTRTRVFFLPMSVSPFRSSMSEFRSFRMPAQSMLRDGGETLGFIYKYQAGSLFFS